MDDLNRPAIVELLVVMQDYKARLSLQGHPDVHILHGNAVSM